MSDFQLKPKYCLFCDDVRREDNGKFLFIGVYTQGIFVPTYPSPVRVSLYLNGSFHGFGTTKFEIRILLQPGDVIVSTMAGDATRIEAPDDEDRFELSIKGVNFQAHGNGNLSLQFRTGDEDWIEVDKVVVKKNDPLSSASPQSS